MPSRQNIAEFLQGFFILPLCALFGGLVALLFRWGHTGTWLCIVICTLFPLVGAVKTRQRALLTGLCAGLILTILSYIALRPHS